MEIKAKAWLHYDSGESMSIGWEGLYLYVKFREGKSLLKTKLKQQLTNARYIENDYKGKIIYKSRQDFYDSTKYFIENKDEIKEIAEEMIKDYFKKKKSESDDDNAKYEILQALKKQEKIEIKVKID